MHPLTEVDRLQARVEELERYAAVAAHELLTPVVMIGASAATVRERLDDGRHPDLLRELDALHGAATRSRVLAETLLCHARSEVRPLELRRVDLGALVRECLTLFDPELRALGAKVHVGVLPEVSVEEPMIGAVFMNLFVNALKYGPRWGATVRVDARTDPRGWRLGVTSVAETIPPEDRELIFEPYRRGRGERSVPGSGLGLAICRQIVERHGGVIGVAPDPDGSGNCFSFTLPAN
jgi:signal transduction histidine kinase